MQSAILRENIFYFFILRGCLRETGNFEKTNIAGKPLTARSPEFKEQILKTIDKSPENNIRKIAIQPNVSSKTIWTVKLKENLL